MCHEPHVQENTFYVREHILLLHEYCAAGDSSGCSTDVLYDIHTLYNTLYNTHVTTRVTTHVATHFTTHCPTHVTTHALLIHTIYYTHAHLTTAMD